MKTYTLTLVHKRIGPGGKSWASIEYRVTAETRFDAENEAELAHPDYLCMKCVEVDYV